MIRFLRSGIPWAVLVLAIGLARQHAAGAGLLTAAEGLVTKARAAIEQLETELTPAVEPPSPVVEKPVPAPLVPQRVAPPFLPPHHGCRH